MKSLIVLLAASAFAADANLLRFAGPGTQAVAGISVSSSLGSPFGQFLLSQMKAEDPKFREFVDSTGFDPRRDLHEVVIITDSVAAKGKGLVIARGVFNGPQLMDFISKQGHGGTATTYKGVALLSNPSGENETVAVLDGSVALAGDTAMVKAAIDRRASGVDMDPRLASKVAEVSGAYDIWGVTMSPADAAQVAGADRMPAEALKAIEQSSAGVKFGTTVRIAGEAIARSEKDAQALADVFKFLTGMMKMNDKQTKNPMASMLDRIVVTTAANTVQFSLSIPQAELEQMFKMRTKMALHAAPGAQ